MKTLIKIIVVICVSLISFTGYAQSNEEITLTVSSDGPTKDDAVKNALRTAIEQAMGAFVSANTTILNDELVKDEVVTLTTGAIKEYKILSETDKPDGKGYLATVNAIVSLPHLITYAKNHGNECEFAGNTFGMQMKLFNLQKENELKALYNAIPQIVEFAKTGMKHILEVSEPTIVDYQLKYEIYESVEYDKHGSKWKNVYKQAKSPYISFPSEDNRYYIPAIMNIPIKRPDGLYSCQIDDFVLESLSNIPNGENALLRFNIKWMPVNKEGLQEYIYEFISNLTLDEDSFLEYQKKGYKVSKFEIDCWNNEYYKYFRNSEQDIKNWFYTLMTALNKVMTNVRIVDNTGTISDFAFQEILDVWNDEMYSKLKKEIEGNPHLEQLHKSIKNRIIQNYDRFTSSEAWSFPGKVYKIEKTGREHRNHDNYNSVECFGGSGLFSKFYVVKLHLPYLYQYLYYSSLRIPSQQDIDVCTIIPFSEIGKYSSFKIESE